MDFTWQDLVDYLLALSGAMPEESSSIHLLYEEDNLLIEKLWFKSKLLKQYLIASDVRTDTPALYLLNDETVDENDWEVELEGEGDISIPQNSKLSGCFTPEGQIVFFQNESGLLQGVEIQDSTWELLDPTAAKPVEGTRHLVIRTANGSLYLFYIGQDKYIHYLVKGPETEEWQDNVLKSPILDQTVVNFMVIPDEDMKFETQLLTTDRLMGIDKEGELTDLGKVVEGKFTPISGKECVIETIRLVKKGVKAIAGKVVEAKKK
ncbi:hypothetical protein TWF788_009876 [Orbilia oligospora]|uniref:Uncharacterized protein n=1 Tax=Orbilia oligospora TaxID=2813651 RepID=A0A7C8Q273_ORBOL|nr:hypothetical protein TWF788_009876 [Orbilia oligospora]